MKFLKCLFIWVLALLISSIAIAGDPPAKNQKTGEPLVIDCLRGTPNIDGKLEDWNLNAITPAILDTEEQIFPGAAQGAAAWDNISDGSGKFYVMWDDENIYLAVVMKDDTIATNKSGGDIWNADCVEVFFSTTNAVAGHAEHYQYGFNANNQKWNWCNMDGAGSKEPDYLKLATTTTANGYLCEVAIEYGQMLSLDFAVGNAIGFHPCFDDTDSSDRELQMTWTGREAHDQSQGFGHLILSAASVSPGTAVSVRDKLPLTWGDIKTR